MLLNELWSTLALGVQSRLAPHQAFDGTLSEERSPGHQQAKAAADPGLCFGFDVARLVQLDDDALRQR